MSELFLNNYLREHEDRVHDEITLTGEYITIFPENDMQLSHDQDPARLSSILAVQSLAMGSLRHAARTKLRSTALRRRHGFAILSESSQSDEAYDGATEEFMSYLITKKDFVNWTMRVRFRQNERTRDAAQESILDDYYFAWRRGRVVVAAGLNSHTITTDNFTSEDVYEQMRPVSDTEVLQLHDRMYDHVEASGAWPEGSFLRPVRFENAA